MVQTSRVEAAATVRAETVEVLSLCTPCSLGIHSCCNTRMRACHCYADWHRVSRPAVRVVQVRRRPVG